MLSALLLLVPTAPASAATQTDVFAAEANALAIKVEVNLPQAIPASVPIIGGLQTAVIDAARRGRGGGLTRRRADSERVGQRPRLQLRRP